MLGVVGEHSDLPIECMALSHDNRFLTTASHDYTIKFWNVAYLFEEDDDDGEGESKTGDQTSAGTEDQDEGNMQTEEAQEMETEPKAHGKNRRKKNSKRGFFAGLK